MINISHRGNLDGKNEKRENHPDYILEAINKGYQVEVDIWYVDGIWYLGHDLPIYRIDFDFIDQYSISEHLWLHTKNFEALKELSKMKNDLYMSWFRYFWHQTDDFTLTSNGYIWTYPGKDLNENSICVLPEQNNYSLEDIEICYGVCSDYILKYEE